ncbi:MAG: glucose-1-phosphate adenylyltransferase [Candidatus Omnitrophica bacterium]|nr:glucose-1-phosphate adenylyltransferase [Candidatus Omnitrophota bacterium]
MIRENIAIILGGGEGRRLFPLTKERSKPAVPVGGKYRLIDIPVSHCINSGIRHIYVLTQFNSASLNNHIYQTYRFDNFTGAFIEVLAAEQTFERSSWFGGTADAVRQNINHFNIKGNEDVLILSSDHLYHMDYRLPLVFHRESKADLTVCAIGIPIAKSKDFGLLKMNNKRRIVNFLEKPQTLSEVKDFILPRHSAVNGAKGYTGEKCCLISMGIYIFKAKKLLKALESNELDFGKEIIPHAIRTMKAYAYPFTGYWNDIGTIKAYYRANIDLTNPHPQFRFQHKNHGIYTHARFLPPAQIIHSSIANALIAEGSHISNAVIERSVVGLRSIIGKNVVLRDSIVIGADYCEEDLPAPKKRGVPAIGIGEHSSIEKAIIDKNVRIGKKVSIHLHGRKKSYDSTLYYIRDGIVVIPKNTVVPDNTKIPS